MFGILKLSFWESQFYPTFGYHFSTDLFLFITYPGNRPIPIDPILCRHFEDESGVFEAFDLFETKIGRHPTDKWN
jgi:hypothetical protein